MLTLIEHLREEDGDGKDIPKLPAEPLRLQQATRFDAVMLDIDIDANSDRSNDDQDDDDDTVDIVGPKRRLETAVGRVDGGGESDDERCDGRVDTAEEGHDAAVSVELDDHKAEHEADELQQKERRQNLPPRSNLLKHTHDKRRKHTQRPTEPTSNVLSKRKAIRAQLADVRSEKAKSPERRDGREAVGGQTEDAGLRDDGELWVAEEEGGGHVWID